ncbi:hypothetical protein CHGG_10338 [Chaetomium globosum CBS 148.51]|uniref:Uncharacterized protein n=1 Tax=Chaetomium globosum (strain ATCC 6205 / CBS 148.51 / DSM 1962 / NBRC 6347 / NRRL 1970) TaxID=306901 RepID=Q2GNW6_CHAGB|nr:uncharacterized protein CHGG_10338 [Chaetomium globosum CBS 148.51]EAQ83934.1 hypothetical protein CHGG_10338 [Chaetomium globosum CBS 148.51]
MASDPRPQPQVESHQSFPESTPGLQFEFYRPPAAPSPVPRFSTSPIPIPTIPTPGRNGHARPNETAAVSLPANTAPPSAASRTTPTLIVVDDDATEILPKELAPVGTLTTRPFEPRMRLPAGEAPYTSPKVVSPPLLAIRSSPVATRVPPLPALGPPIPSTPPSPAPPPLASPKQLVQRIHRGAPQNWRREAHAISLARVRMLLSTQGEFSPAARWPSEQRRAVSCLITENFNGSKGLKDLIHQKTSSKPAMLAIRRDDGDQRGELIRASRVHSLLFAREVSGQRLGATRSQRNFFNEFRTYREDALEKKAEWTGCAGDIFTIVWVSNAGFLCGTTEHSDAHNQQYNKPGNLVLGSCLDITLRAYPEHRIVRPVVEKGENSTEAMRQSQDPWLYSSVVSSDYDAVHDRAFTCSFDKTVKIWKVQKSGSSMSLLGEWKHDATSTCAASKHESGMVATAPTWRPMQSVSTAHLLLVGYSPRSRTGDDNDIPELRRDSGELCLWDGVTGERWRVTSATTQNVFEVLWHPSQDCFIAATSPLGLELEPSVHTQIRIFRPADQDEFGVKAYSPIKTLDCTAVDINELTIIWLHGWQHPIDEYRGDREREDVGVKFCAWGTTPDRFYTGSSDGVVKVWNIRSLSKPLVRNLIQAPAPITAGMFCPDKTRLVVGDASGRVFMFSIQEEKEQAMSSTQVPLPGAAGFKTIQRPPAITPHPDPPAPTHDAEGRLIVSESGFYDRPRLP